MLPWRFSRWRLKPHVVIFEKGGGFFSLFFPFFNSFYSILVKVWSLKWSLKYNMLNYKSIHHFKIIKIAAGQSKMALKMGKKSSLRHEALKSK